MTDWGGWLFEPEDGSGPTRRVTQAMFESHMRHWQLESVSPTEIVFNNDFWEVWHPGWAGSRRRFYKEVPDGTGNASTP